MKKLIILLIIFIPLLSFGQKNNKKVELLKTRFVELNMKENIALSEMLKSNRIKSNDYKVRLEKLKSQFFKTKFILNKISPNIPNLNKILLDPEIRFKNNEFQFKAKNKWFSDVELISFLIKKKEDNFLNKNDSKQIISDLYNSNIKYFFKNKNYLIFEKPIPTSRVIHRIEGGYSFRILDRSNSDYFFIQTEKRELGYVLKNKLPEIN
tara:strand:- start:701 stop:1327 length:627 start_codon:yes stop_codon:yes gene_type:complete